MRDEGKPELKELVRKEDNVEQEERNLVGKYIGLPDYACASDTQIFAYQIHDFLHIRYTICGSLVMVLVFILDSSRGGQKQHGELNSGN